MRSLASRLHGALLGGALAGTLMGCAIDATDIDTWPAVAGGSQRLAGYALDTKRPLELRMRAVRGLFGKGDLDHLMAVIDRAEDRPALAMGAAELVIETLPGADAAAPPGETQWRALALGYLLLEDVTPLGDALADRLATAVADRGLAWLALPPKGSVAPEVAVLGAAVARPLVVVPPMVTAARAAKSEDGFLYLVDLLAELREPAVDLSTATLLLERARRSLPQLSPALAARMKANGNETLLRVLVGTVGDVRVPPPVRTEGLNAASRLGARAVPALLEALAMQQVDDDYRWVTLVAVWSYGGPPQLAAALRALPTEGQWPTEGASFKDAIEGFCDNRLAEKPGEVRPILLELLEDPSWVARAFSLACIGRLFPAEAFELARPLRKDTTPLPGWSEAGAGMTLGAAALALKSP